MENEQYSAIKATYQTFIDAWKNNQPALLNRCFIPETACNLSTIEKYPCGGQHGILGVESFISQSTPPDFFYILPCNFVARIKEDQAQQSAILVCRAGVIEDDQVRVIEFSALNVNSWIKTENGWRIRECKLDITECSGDYQEFIEHWYFEHQDLTYYFGIHLPVISGELDAPWYRIPIEDAKAEVDAVLETFARYAYGIDTLSFDQLIPVLSEDLVVNMAPWGAMDKREFMQTLKFKRQAGRYWNHPAQLDTIRIHQDQAILTLHRMAGHRQSAMPIIFTKDNYDTCYADARYEIKLQKEQGSWRILRMDYFLGTINLGKFTSQ